MADATHAYLGNREMTFGRDDGLNQVSGTGELIFP